jgi:hypothetical protein
LLRHVRRRSVCSTATRSFKERRLFDSSVHHHPNWISTHDLVSAISILSMRKNARVDGNNQASVSVMSLNLRVLEPNRSTSLVLLMPFLPSTLETLIFDFPSISSALHETVFFFSLARRLREWKDLRLCESQGSSYVQCWRNHQDGWRLSRQRI